MNNHLKQFLGMFFVAALSGCATPTYIIKEGYRGKEINANQLVVAPFTTLILNKDDVVDDLGSGVAEEVFQKYFDSTFAANVIKSSRIKSVQFGKQYSKANLLEQQLPLSEKESIKISIPKDNETIEIDSLSPQFVLFIGNYSIDRSAASSGTYTAGTGGGAGTYSGGSMGSLREQLDFSIWDNTKGKLISYGRIQVESGLFLGMVKTNWNLCATKIADKIVQASPFIYKK